jgi:hypothetical protein
MRMNRLATLLWSLTLESFTLTVRNSVEACLKIKHLYTRLALADASASVTYSGELINGRIGLAEPRCDS